ncbi:hypothetical protein M430DRAFT_197468 [Amorphotheca resinae ATCC 22711]|jgi:hypothetical protein|uniref:Uncharacterized protein n=1 Tax=Amorphotheca resinae ATCC 22711 TaxID=857342 RepID=A0A2T3B9L8_AMORE|nr:hypothetical protein M430DRAFT_197468 [Amorphotheca resinae ATCC 22711]PSS25013.1 hypothetical protein M430DRAFT_197468 [Amorphotheca resinae ATCC 22711]
MSRWNRCRSPAGCGGVQTYTRCGCVWIQLFPGYTSNAGSICSVTLLCATIDFPDSLFMSVFRSSSSSFLIPSYYSSSITPTLSPHINRHRTYSRPVVRDVADRGWLVGRTSCCMAWPSLATIWPPRGYYPAILSPSFSPDSDRGTLSFSEMRWQWRRCYC